LNEGAYSEVVHVGEEDVDFDNLGDVRACSLDNGLQVLGALSRLLADGTLNEGHIGSDGDLAGAVDGRRGLDGLGLKQWFG
jgi:hypothetical protein